MGKRGEHTKCPICDEEMTLVVEKEPNGDPKWKGWVCSNPQCRHRTEESFPHSGGVYGGEVRPTEQTGKTGEDSGSE